LVAAPAVFFANAESADIYKRENGKAISAQNKRAPLRW
jgi:hypothetical protein